jgi:chitinase
MDSTVILGGVGMGLMVSFAVSAGTYYYRDTLCRDYKLLCPVAPTSPPPAWTTVAVTDTTTSTPGPAAGSVGSGRLAARTFSPYLMLTPTTVSFIGKSRWTTLAFVMGFSNGKIVWDAGNPSTSAIKLKADAAKKTGGGVIVSFGGQTAGKSPGKKGFAELAGSYTDAAKLAAAYISIADSLGSTWLDFDVEGKALTDAKSVNIRAQALKALQVKRPDIIVQFTVPVGLHGLDSTTKSFLSNVKSTGVKIHLVNIMTMYMIKTKTKMSDACMKAAAAAKPFIDTLGAKIGITPQLGKNPDKPYTAENFTSVDADRLVSAAKKAGYVTFVGFWEMSMKDKAGTFAKKFKVFE